MTSLDKVVFAGGLRYHLLQKVSPRCFVETTFLGVPVYKRILSQGPLENEVNLEFKELDWIEWWNEPKIGKATCC